MMVPAALPPPPPAEFRWFDFCGLPGAGAGVVTWPTAAFVEASTFAVSAQVHLVVLVVLGRPCHRGRKPIIKLATTVAAVVRLRFMVPL
jgi:hypothetical protein